MTDTPLIKTHVDLPFGVRSFFVGITKTKFDSLPAKARQAIRKNGGFGATKFLGDLQGRTGDRIRTQAAKDTKRNVITPSEQQRKQIFARFKKLHEDWIANTKDGKKKYDALQAILVDLRKSS